MCLWPNICLFGLILSKLISWALSGYLVQDMEISSDTLKLRVRKIADKLALPFSIGCGQFVIKISDHARRQSVLYWSVVRRKLWKYHESGRGRDMKSLLSDVCLVLTILHSLLYFRWFTEKYRCCQIWKVETLFANQKEYLLGLCKTTLAKNGWKIAILMIWTIIDR